MRFSFRLIISDDESLFASFLCLRFKPLVVVVLRSEKQAADGITAETREAETARAMEVLGCDWAQWPVGDGKPNWTMVATMMRELGKPERVFAPAFEPLGHEQHNEVAWLAQQIFGSTVTYYLTYTSAGKSSWGKPVPFEDEWVPVKLEALACYQSQMNHPKQVAHFMRDQYEYTV